MRSIIQKTTDPTKNHLQVVWAKFSKYLWPALVWDPRFLAKHKAGRELAKKAYASLGKSHLVKFYDARNSFACVPFK